MNDLVLFLLHPYLRCRMASEGKLLSVQISALDNMHYSNMIRFDNMAEAR